MTKSNGMSQRVDRLISKRTSKKEKHRESNWNQGEEAKYENKTKNNNTHAHIKWFVYIDKM